MPNYPENGIEQEPLLEKEVFSNGRVEVSDTSYDKIRYEEALVVDDSFQKRNQKGGQSGESCKKAKRNRVFGEENTYKSLLSDSIQN